MTKVTYNSKNDEWYTPLKYIELAREAMGSIDLDPASSEKAQEIVRASAFFTKDDSGLDPLWWGNVWLNPPYSRKLIRQFINKICLAYGFSTIDQAIVLVNNCTETRWFQKLSSVSSAIALPKGRIKYLGSDGKTKNSPIQGQAFLYLGDNPDRFDKVFSSIGEVYIKNRRK